MNNSRPCTQQNIRLLCVCLFVLVIVLLFYHIVHTNRSPDDEQGDRGGHVMFNLRKFSPPRINTSQSWNYNWDRRDPNTYPKESSLHGSITATRTLVLIRHGQYGPTGELTALGRKQADMTGKRLAEMGLDYRVIIHSTMIRAAQTAQIISKHLKGIPMQQDELIREGGPVPPDPTITYFQLPNLDYFLDSPRIEGAFRKYFHRAEPSQKKDSVEILVGHGNVNRYFLLRTLQFPRAAWMRFFIPHGSMSMLSMRPDSSVSCDQIGNAGYMPVNMVTY